MKMLPLRFKSVEDYEAFLAGDRSRAILRFIEMDGKSALNPEYDKAPFELFFTELGPPIEIVDVQP